MSKRSLEAIMVKVGIVGTNWITERFLEAALTVQ